MCRTRFVVALLCMAPYGVFDARTCNAANERFTFHGVAMGTTVRLVVYAESRALANHAWQVSQNRLAEIEHVLSDYRPTSESRVFTRQSGKDANRRWIPISRDLHAVLNASLDLHRQSGGAFDVTVGPLSRLWRRARIEGRPPEPDAIADALRNVGAVHIELHPKRQAARCLRRGMRLDFGGIGKGYAADEVLRTLRDMGRDHVLIALGGDIAVMSPQGTARRGPDDVPTTPWRIAWQAEGTASEEANRASSPTIALASGGVSTSGDAARGFEFQGVRYSHVIDPRTGMALRESWSVTVIAESGLLADGLASALSVLGPDEGIAWLEKHFPSAAACLWRVQASERHYETSGNFPKDALPSP